MSRQTNTTTEPDGAGAADALRIVALREQIRTEKKALSQIRERANAQSENLTDADRHTISFHAGRIDMAYSVLRMFGCE